MQILVSVSFQSSTQMLAVPYIVPLTNMAMTGRLQHFLLDFEKLCPGSVYTVVAITVERYTTLRQIHKVRW